MSGFGQIQRISFKGVSFGFCQSSWNEYAALSQRYWKTSVFRVTLPRATSNPSRFQSSLKYVSSLCTSQGLFVPSSCIRYTGLGFYQIHQIHENGFRGADFVQIFLVHKSVDLALYIWRPWSFLFSYSVQFKLVIERATAASLLSQSISLSFQHQKDPLRHRDEET